MTARRVRIGLALVLVALVAACVQVPLLGILALDITAPPGVVPSVDVTGPDFSDEVSASGELTGLTPGTYDIDPNPVEAGNTAYTGFERFGAEPSSVEVVAGETTDATVDYAYVGFRIPDPDDDADGAVGPDPIYDAVEFSSEVVGNDIVLTIVLRDDQDDLSALIGYVDIDVDRDDATGIAPFMNAFCDPVELGIEAQVAFDAGVPEASVETTSGVVDVDIAVDGNVVTITVPLAAIDSTNGRVHAGLVIGNFDEPTDCVPGGAGSL